MDRIIEIKVNGSHLTKDSNVAGVQHEANAKKLRITFDEGWDGYAKKVTFWNALDQNPTRIILGANRLEDITVSTRVYLCPIPGEAMTQAGKCRFVIDGWLEGVRQRSVEDKLKVIPAGFDEEAGEPADPAPSQAEQLQRQIDTMLADMQAAVQSAQTAKGYAEAAEESAKKAGTPPYVGENGNWFEWDLAAGQFVDTGVRAHGDAFAYEDFTQEQLAALMEPVENDCKDYLSVELAKRGQLKPEFANSTAELEESGDTTKLYVLPDGYIYAYMTGAEALYTNQLLRAVDSDGSAYNAGKGWKADARLNSEGAEVEQSGMEVTGFIPVAYGAAVRVKNLQFVFGGDSSKHSYIFIYDKDFNATAYTRADITPIGSAFTVNDNSELDSFNVVAAGGFSATLTQDNVAYFRLSAVNINSDSVITVNEEILVTGEHAWRSTGHAFVPADYEDRIVAVEAASLSHEARIQSLENGADVGVPDYVVTEAEAVIDRVIAAQGSRTFTFAAITDLHYGNNGNKLGVEHAAKAMKYIDRRIKLDAVAVLGDYTDGYPASGLDNAIGDFKAVNRVLDELRFSPNLRVQGNHDYYAENFPMTHRFIQAYSDGVVWGDRLGGYFYKDFADFKLRVICLNTVENGNDNINCSAGQYSWFAGALDLSGKDDAADWQLIVFSHHPVDWWYTDGSYAFAHILNAYQTGGSWSGAGVSCSFAGKNTAKLIGNIHGHIHNLLTDKIYSGNPASDSSSQYNIYRLCTPEACVGRENQYDGVWKEATGYPKTASTAEETSFCVYCIDLDAGIIKAICYGAGYDREISYRQTNDDATIAVLGVATLGTMVLGSGG